MFRQPRPSSTIGLPNLSQISNEDRELPAGYMKKTSVSPPSGASLAYSSGFSTQSSWNVTWTASSTRTSSGRPRPAVFSCPDQWAKRLSALALSTCGLAEA